MHEFIIILHRTVRTSSYWFTTWPNMHAYTMHDSKITDTAALYFGFLTGACMLLVGHESAHAVRAGRTTQTHEIYGSELPNPTYVCACCIPLQQHRTYKIFNSTYSIYVIRTNLCMNAYACWLDPYTHMHVRIRA